MPLSVVEYPRCVSEYPQREPASEPGSSLDSDDGTLPSIAAKPEEVHEKDAPRQVRTYASPRLTLRI